MCSAADDPTQYDAYVPDVLAREAGRRLARVHPEPQPPRVYRLAGDAPEPRVVGLDDAWNAATAALPDGWRIHILEATAQNEWRAVAGVRVDNGTDPFIAIREGATPVDALSALASALREAR